MLKKALTLLCLALFLLIGVAQNSCFCAENSPAVNNQSSSCNQNFLSRHTDLCEDCGHDQKCCNTKFESFLPTGLQETIKQDTLQQIVFVVKNILALEKSDIPNERLAHPPPFYQMVIEKSYIVKQALLL